VSLESGLLDACHFLFAQKVTQKGPQNKAAHAQAPLARYFGKASAQVPADNYSSMNCFFRPIVLKMQEAGALWTA
jgi:hypothetical protein